MLPDGRLDGGVNGMNVDMESDVKPIIDDMKQMWRNKITGFDQEKANLNDEILQNETDLRNLKEEVQKI